MPYGRETHVQTFQVTTITLRPFCIWHGKPLGGNPGCSRAKSQTETFCPTIAEVGER